MFDNQEMTELVAAWNYDVVPWGAQSSWAGTRGVLGLKDMLLEKGREGWELATTLDQAGDPEGSLFIFKRPALQ